MSGRTGGRGKTRETAINRFSLACAAAAGLVPALAAAEAAKLEPLGRGQPAELHGSFGFTTDEQKLRRSASGIACLSPTDCLVVFDEGREARRAALSSSGYRAGAAVALPVGGDEGDAEAVAAEGGRFYVTGSHSMKRTVKKGACRQNPASRFVARVEADGRVTPGNLLPAIEAVPQLKAALGECLAEGTGLDIEGLAATKAHLWFGFRGPSAPGGAYLLKVNIGAPFGEGAYDAKLLVADVGEGRAIRDMQAVGSRLLLLAGPPRGVDDPIGYALVWFDPDAAEPGPRPSAPARTLDLSGVERRKLDGCKDEKKLADIKPEGLMVVDPAAETLRVAILSDGLCDGGPLWFDVSR